MSKAFTPTSRMIELAESIFKAMAFIDTIKPIIEANRKKVLEENKFRPGGKLVEKLLSRGVTLPEFVLEEKQTHHLTDEDFDSYHKQVTALNLTHGLTVEHPDECPLLVTENLLARAENALLDELKPLTGFGSEQAGYSLEIRAKAIDLTLRMLAPFTNSKKILNDIKNA